METKEQPVVPEAVPDKKAGVRKIIFRVILGIAVVVGGYYGISHFLWTRTHESTENAQVAGDVVIVSPLVSGTIDEIKVADNAEVKKGDVLVILSSSKLKAAVAQAQANLDAAVADAEAAGIAVNYTAATANADQATAAGGVSEAQAGVSASRVGVASASASLASAQAQEKASQADVANTEMDRKVAQESLVRYQAAVRSAQAVLEATKSQLEAAQAARDSAEATHTLAKQELERTEKLYEAGAVSGRDRERAQASEKTAAAALASATSQVASAQAAIRQRESDLEGAQAQVSQAQAAIAQATSRIDAAKQKVNSAKAVVDVARLQISAANEAVRSSEARRASSLGKQSASQAGQIQVQKMNATQRQAQAKVEQAKAALETAQLDLDHAVIYAPVDGRVSKRIAEIGGQAQVGGPLLYLVPANSIFVIANFKETQISRLHPGQEVEVEIDGVPGKPMHGKIESLSAATGAAFALLPPDNATGNFVKVVQRVPVKISLEASEIPKDLRVGLSATVTVDLK
jgi:membrane fusion protein (multidrug efflux system)